MVGLVLISRLLLLLAGSLDTLQDFIMRGMWYVYVHVLMCTRELVQKTVQWKLVRNMDIVVYRQILEHLILIVHKHE